MPKEKAPAPVVYKSTVLDDLIGGALDVDMLLFPLQFASVARISKYWSTSHAPPVKILSEGPKFLASLQFTHGLACGRAGGNL